VILILGGQLQQRSKRRNIFLSARSFFREGLSTAHHAIIYCNRETFPDAKEEAPNSRAMKRLQFLQTSIGAVSASLTGAYLTAHPQRAL
jgi:hypothetical protein